MTTQLCDWWDALPPRRQALIRWAGPLLALAVVITLDWWRLQTKGVATGETTRELLGRVGYTAAACVAVMLLGVRRWPLQSLGLLSLLVGLAGLCVRIVARWGPQPVGERERDLIQAALNVGSIVLLIGLLIWFAGRLLGRGADAPTNGGMR